VSVPIKIGDMTQML